MRITTNLAFDDWAPVSQGERMTAALLDRFTHRCYNVERNGETMLKRSGWARIA